MDQPSVPHGVSGFTASEQLLADPVALGMAPHPEGGWYRETWRHPNMVSTPRGPRHLVTTVAFLLLPGERSNWHRVVSDELWIWQGGGRLRVSHGGSEAFPEEVSEIAEFGAGGQHLVPGRTWQSAEPVTEHAVLLACVVSPGFDFTDFEMAI